MLMLVRAANPRWLPLDFSSDSHPRLISQAACWGACESQVSKCALQTCLLPGVWCVRVKQCCKPCSAIARYTVVFSSPRLFIALQNGFAVNGPMTQVNNIKRAFLPFPLLVLRDKVAQPLPPTTLFRSPSPSKTAGLWASGRAWTTTRTIPRTASQAASKRRSGSKKHRW